MSFYNLTFAGQGDISEVDVVSQFTKRCLDNVLEIIPLQTQLLSCHNVNAWMQVEICFQDLVFQITFDNSFVFIGTEGALNIAPRYMVYSREPIFELRRGK